MITIESGNRTRGILAFKRERLQKVSHIPLIITLKVLNE